MSSSLSSEPSPGESHDAPFANPDHPAPRLVRTKARGLVLREVIPRQELEDFEQDLAVEALRALDRFDPDRGRLEPYLDRVLDNFIVSWLRKRFAGRRGGGREVLSLQETQVDDPGRAAEWGRTLPESAGARRRGGPEIRADGPDLALDVRLFVEGLPGDLRDFAGRLLRLSPRAVGEELGWSRHRVQRTLETLRRRCDASGLRDYHATSEKDGNQTDHFRARPRKH